MGIEEIVDGKLQITPPKRRQKEVTITQSERYGDIAILYTLLSQFGIIKLLNELIRPSGLVYYEDQRKPIFDVNGRAIVCFNHTDLEQERSIRLKKIAIAEDKAAIKGVSDYFIVKNEYGKCLIFTTDFEKVGYGRETISDVAYETLKVR